MNSTEHTVHKVATTAALTTGGLIVAPYVLPLFGVGSFSTANTLVSSCGSGLGLGVGFAGAVNTALSEIPLIGPSLIAGTLSSILISGGIGLGGMWLGNYIEKHADKNSNIPWGKIIKYTALATSLLIALPSLLSGISIGVAFLASAVCTAPYASSIFKGMADTVGLAGGVTTGGSLTGLLPHLLTCGAASLPLIGSLFTSKSHAEKERAPMPKLELPPNSWAARIQNTPAATASHSL